MVLHSLIYSVAIFAGLLVISIFVAAIMKLIYSVVHRSENKKDIKTETKSADAATPGKTV